LVTWCAFVIGYMCSGWAHWLLLMDSFYIVSPKNDTLFLLHEAAVLARSGDRNFFCLSVRLSVSCVLCDEIKEHSANILLPHGRVITLVFCHQQWLVMSPSTWNLHLKWPTLFAKCRFWPISAYNVSTIRAIEKCSIVANRKLTTCFPTSWCPHRVAQKCNFVHDFANNAGCTGRQLKTYQASHSLALVCFCSLASQLEPLDTLF